MRPISTIQAKRMLRQASCAPLRTKSHETWVRPDGHTFASPMGKKEIAPGIMRQLRYFVQGEENYHRR